MGTRLHSIEILNQTQSGPSQVIVVDHDSLRGTSGTRGVDECAAVTGLLAGSALVNNSSQSSISILSKGKEILPVKDICKETKILVWIPCEVCVKFTYLEECVYS